MVLVIFLLPYTFDFLFLEFVSVIFVRIAILDVAKDLQEILRLSAEQNRLWDAYEER